MLLGPRVSRRNAAKFEKNPWVLIPGTEDILCTAQEHPRYQASGRADTGGSVMGLLGKVVVAKKIGENREEKKEEAAKKKAAEEKK